MAKKTVTEILTRTAQLIQRSNQWTQGTYEETTRDNQGKTRTCRCLAGAALVAAGLSANVDDALDSRNATRRVKDSLLKTLRSNPERYNAVSTNSFGERSEDTQSVEDFNDASQVRHADVLRLVKDTLARVSA